MTAERYEVSFFIGPCEQGEAEALAEAIVDLPEFEAVGGGGVGLQRIAEGDPLFADAKEPWRA